MAEKKKTKKNEKKSGNKYLLIFWGIFSAIIFIIFLIFFLLKVGAIGYIPPIEELQNPKNKNASEIYSSDMVLLGSYFSQKENRISTTYSELSPYVVEALIATEDERYLDHSGIDGKAMARVFFKTVIMQNKNAGGGSTISQQLAKQLYSPPSKTFADRMVKKLNEWVIAVELERLYTKEEILTMYLNQFDFLYNAVGIKTASQVYFDTTPDSLKIEEAAVLIGMCKNPSLYNPKKYPENTKNRRNVVLKQMEKNSFITEAQYDSLKTLDLVLKYNKVDHKEGLATYFREYLRQMMMAKEPVKKNYAGWQMQKYYEDSLQWQKNPLYGWCNKNQKLDGTNYNIYVDGLKIYTAINSRMQRYAEEAVQEHLGEYLQPRFFNEKKGKSYAPFTQKLTTEQVNGILKRSKKQSERYIMMKKNGATEAQIDSAFKEKVPMTVFSWEKGSIDTIMSPSDSILYLKHFLRCGFMSMDPYNGQVKAYVGGPDYRYFQYDMVTSGKRQVGSTIKPFLYTLAMEEGYTPCDLVPNVSQTLIDENGKKWTPRNSNKNRAGEMVTIRWGLSQSNNNVTAYLMKQFTPQTFVKLMQSFGITSKLDPVVSLALGPAEISVKEMVASYTTFVNKGIRVEPIYVTRIEDKNGNVITNFIPEMNEVISAETSYKMIDMLSAVTNGGGTAVRLRYRYKIEAPMGAKTGTTQNNSDGWFMGFTPSLVSGCWVGGEDRSIRFDRMADGQGATMALPIFALYMQKVYADKNLGYKEDEKFDIPAGFDPCKTDLTKQSSNEFVDID
ncbi:transglycosylase domain-containing protein [Bacteroidales bacterium OttesenSCG-928-I21]|nr:transglycosylase domain-containing protein [Bacteroidales bacterium OttesenSCG-928-I21]